MKIFNQAALLLPVLAALLGSSSAQAFTLKPLSSRNVADANYCGDFNVLRTYSLGLNAAERLPAPFMALLAQENLDLIEQELREHFVAPGSGGKLVTLAMGLRALGEFAASPYANQDACFGEDFGELFSYSFEDKRLEPTDPQGVLYLRVAIQDGGNTTSTPATVVIDRRSQKLYIHQIW